jgi:hypothetical protein
MLHFNMLLHLEQRPAILQLYQHKLFLQQSTKSLTQTPANKPSCSQISYQQLPKY